MQRVGPANFVYEADLYLVLVYPSHVRGILDPYPFIHLRPDREEDVENRMWLEVLRPFPAVENFYLCKNITPHMGLSLKELLGRRATEVLPFVENIFLEGLQPRGPVPEGIEKFQIYCRATALRSPCHCFNHSISKRDMMRLMPGWVSGFYD